MNILQYSKLLLHSLAACSYAADAMPFAFLGSVIEDMSTLSLRDRSIQAKCTLQWLQYLAFVSDMRGSFSAGFCTTFYINPNSRLRGLTHLCCCTNDPPGSSRTMMAIS